MGKTWLNHYKKDLMAERILKMAAKGPGCWDCAYYRSQNSAAHDMNCIEAFSHFVNRGQFKEEAAFRCVILRDECMFLFFGT